MLSLHKKNQDKIIKYVRENIEIKVAFPALKKINIYQDKIMKYVGQIKNIISNLDILYYVIKILGHFLQNYLK